MISPVPRRVLTAGILTGAIVLSSCAGDDDGNSIRINAVDISYEQSTYKIEAGPARIEFRNRGTLAHNLVFREADGAPVAAGEREFLPAGQDQRFDVDLEAGEYEFYCSVPGHEEAGMISTLVVGSISG
jgi:plastocyanin